MRINKTKIKSIIKDLGYNSYMQDVICDYFIIKEFGVTKKAKTIDVNGSIIYLSIIGEMFDSLRSKEIVLDTVFPVLVERKEEYYNKPVKIKRDEY